MTAPRIGGIIRQALSCGAMLLALAGCESMARGFASGLVNKDKADPATRLCDVAGPSFPGLADMLKDATAAAPKTARLLVVHGLGEYTSGYSEFFVRRIADHLHLGQMDPAVKEITIRSGKFSGEMGKVVVRRFTDGQGRSLLVFEALWSPVTEAERALVKFDDKNAASNQRAGINKTLKHFVNAHLVDPLAYMGIMGPRIEESIAQSLCWTAQERWENYPQQSATVCEWKDADVKVMASDGFAIATHSLGSRIAIDTLTALGGAETEPGAAAARAVFRTKTMPLYMMSNQLPLMQGGRRPPEIVNAAPRYCTAQSADAGKRWLKQLDVVAFSDPNDVLTYPIPSEFTRNFIDSRLCPAVTNVTVKVADESNLAGLTTFAMPDDAHEGYGSDDRVVAMIADGLDSAEPPTGCSWLKEAAPVATAAP